jgi:cytochrome c-type biogenesis protein CcmH/NrfG
VKTSAKNETPPACAAPVPADQPTRLVGLLLALITMLVYLPAGWHDFIFFDDPSYVTDNPMVQNGLTWAGFKWALVGWHASNWHPLTWLSHQLDCQLFGLNAGAHHLVNVLFHTANTVLLFQLWLRLTKACWPSALVAALFAWHPLHVESVAWVAERKDVLSTFFGLLALLAYARFAGQPEIRGPKPKVWYGVSLGMFALALLAKPMLVTLPFLLLLLDYWPLRRFTEERRWLTEGAQLAGEKWPFFLFSALSCGCTLLAQRGTAVVTLQQYGLDLRAENAVVAVAGYLGKLVWPVNLSIFYPLPKNFPPAEVLLAVAVLAAVTLFVWRERRHHRCALMGWLWFLGMLVPVIGLVQVGDQGMADRYTYLPAVGLFVAGAFGIEEVRGCLQLPLRGLIAGAALILASCLALTTYQLRFWQDSETLFTHALAVNQPGRGVLGMLGFAGETPGQTNETTGNDWLLLQGAGGEKRSFAAQVQLMFGQSAEQKGRSAEAIDHYRAALRLDPDIVEAHNNLGNLLAAAGQPQAALAEYQAAVALRPEAPLAHENLGAQLVELRRFDDALREYQAAGRLAPDAAQPWYLTGKLWLRRGQSGAAVTAFENALRLNANDVPSLVYLARVLASDESPENRNGPLAVALAGQANTLTGGNQPFVLGTLAMAYAEAGQFDDARKSAQAALNLADRPSAKSELQAQLQLYEANQPFREIFTNPTGK